MNCIIGLLAASNWTKSPGSNLGWIYSYCFQCLATTHEITHKFCNTKNQLKFLIKCIWTYFHTNKQYSCPHHLVWAQESRWQDWFLLCIPKLNSWTCFCRCTQNCSQLFKHMFVYTQVQSAYHVSGFVDKTAVSRSCFWLCKHNCNQPTMFLAL